jgi:hypothetical protein
MDPIGHALRLMNTTQAGLGVGLAALVVVIAVAIAVRRRARQRTGWIPVLLIVCTGFLAGAVIIETTYSSWYRHRCVDHSSDIDECFGKDGKRLHERY